MADADPLCPKCRGKLWMFYHKGTLIERCSQCDGMWFDEGELSISLGMHKPLRGDMKAELTDVPCIRCDDQKLAELTFPGSDVLIDVCPACKSIWLDRGELDRLRAAVRPIVGDDRPTPEQIRRAAEEVEAAERAFDRKGRCPKCGEKLWNIQRRGMIIEQCSGCEGLWFDAGELVKLLEVSQKLDLAAGRKSGQRCFKCATAPELVTLLYPRTEVEIDVCPECSGLWLDKGELEQLQDAVARVFSAADPHHEERRVGMFFLMRGGAGELGGADGREAAEP